MEMTLEELKAKHAEMKKKLAEKNKHLTDEEIKAKHNKLKRAQRPKPTAAELDRVAHENHPDVGTGLRAGIKNLIRDKAKTGLGVLKTRMPDHDVRMSEEGKLQIKRPDEDTWRYVDKPMLGSKWSIVDQVANLIDDPKDLLDIGGDAVKGTVDTLGTLGGGILGFFGGGGVGAVPGAMAGGTGTSVATEGVRQTIAKKLGFEDDYSGKALLREGIIGGASPLLLGTGATAKHALKALGKDATPEAIEAFMKTQRGGLGRGRDFITQKVLPGVANTISGIEPGALNYAAKNLDEVKRAAKDKRTTGKLIKSYDKKINEAIDSKISDIGEKLDVAAAHPNVKVDMTVAEQPLDNLLKTSENEVNSLIEEVGLKAAKKDSAYKDYKTIKKQIEKYGTKRYQLDGKAIRKYKDRNKTLTKVDKDPDFKGSSDAANELKAAFKQTNSNIKDALENTPEGKLFNDLNQQSANAYTAKARYREVAGGKNANKNTLESTMSNLNSKARSSRLDDISNVEDVFDVDIQSMADQYQALKYFANPSWLPVSRGGTTSTSKTILGDLFGALRGAGQIGLSDGVIKKAMQTNRLLQAPMKNSFSLFPAAAPAAARGGLSQLDPWLEQLLEENR